MNNHMYMYICCCRVLARGRERGRVLAFRGKIFNLFKESIFLNACYKHIIRIAVTSFVYIHDIVYSTYVVKGRHIAMVIACSSISLYTPAHACHMHATCLT